LSPYPSDLAISEMPEDQKRPKRPRDVIGNAVRVMEIATGQREEEVKPEEARNEAAAELGRKGGKARAKALSQTERAKIAKRAAEMRWAARVDDKD